MTTATWGDATVTWGDALFAWDGSEIGANEAPVVDAGSDQAFTLPTEGGTLAGSATDDGVPVSPGSLTYLWETVSGPGPVTFVDDTDPETDYTVPAAGTYVLQLSAYDGELTGTDTMSIVVTPATPAASSGSAKKLGCLGFLDDSYDDTVGGLGVGAGFEY
jgi:hypothetical protein